MQVLLVGAGGFIGSVLRYTVSGLVYRAIPIPGFPYGTLVVNLIGSTKTEAGLEVHAWLDESEYEKSKQVSDAQLAEVIIKRNNFHGEWNYRILPAIG